MKITKWWWALAWGASAWISAAMSSEHGWRTPVGFGLLIGVVWGALAMRWSIILNNLAYRKKEDV